MPDFSSDTGLITMPIWAAGAAAALFLFVTVIALSRAGSVGFWRAAGSFVVIALIALAAWKFLDRAAIRDIAVERHALEARASQLTAQALAAGSPLSCLDGLAGENVEAACEKTLFSSPESVAAAVSYVSSKLSLMADGMDFASRSDPQYQNALAPLRLALEADRFGIVAHVLSVRENCTTVQCPLLALMHNATRIQANLKDRTFESFVGRYAAEWNVPQVSAAEPASGATTTGHPVSPRYDFPSASSIPPVNIMSPEPLRPSTPAVGAPPVAESPTAAAPQSGATPIPPRRPPPARAAQRPAPPSPAAQRPPPAPPAAPRPITPPVAEQPAPSSSQ